MLTPITPKDVPSEILSKLNLGCGVSFYKGWLNINYWQNIPELFYKDPNGVEGTFLLNWNLVKGIPLESDSVDICYHSHFLEHLSYEDGIRMIREVYRVLKPGGVHRLVLPDLRKWVNAYFCRDNFFFDQFRKMGVQKKDPVEWPTNGSVLTGMLHGHEHKAAWDFETLSHHLNASGFHEIKETFFQESVIPEIKEIEPYDYLRAVESLCVDSRKPV